MDTFVEQIVKKNKQTKEWGIIVLTILAAVALAVVGFIFLFRILAAIYLLILFGIGYGVWWIVTSQNVEYEYSVTNGDIDIDMIIAQRKRKRVVSVAGSKIEEMKPFDPQNGVQGRYDRMVVAAPSQMEQGLWAFKYHSKRNGNTLVLFQPNERVLNALVAGLPRLQQIEIKRDYLTSQN